MAEPEELIGTADVAEQFNVTTRAVQRWIDRGMLPANYVAGRWVVRRADVAAFVPPKRGRPLSTRLEIAADESKIAVDESLVRKAHDPKVDSEEFLRDFRAGTVQHVAGMTQTERDEG